MQLANDFPTPPENLMIEPEKLSIIEEDTIKLSDFLSVIINNYGTAEKNSIRLKLLQHWINKQYIKKQ